MGENQTIYATQIDAVTGILERIRTAVSPEFIGIISTRGLPVSVLTSSSDIDIDVLSSLAASSFSATSQLSRATQNPAYAVMFHEGNDANIHISRISDLYLLVIIFRNASDIGKVRVISKRAYSALAAALEPAAGGIIKKENGARVEETKRAIDQMLSDGRITDGTD